MGRKYRRKNTERVPVRQPDRVLSYFDLKRGESKEIPVKLTATYKGRYYLPSIYCEAMYDNSVRALKKGEWIEVVE